MADETKDGESAVEDSAVVEPEKIVQPAPKPAPPEPVPPEVVDDADGKGYGYGTG